MSNFWNDAIGTTKSFFKLGFTGVRLKNNAGNLSVRNPGDTADAEATVSRVNISGDGFVINSDAANSGADWSITINRPTTGMSAAVTYTLPPDDGTPGQVMSTDGAGVLSWASAASTAAADKMDSTPLAFGTASPVAMFSTGAGDIIDRVVVVVDTAFNGTPTMSVGIAGTTSKYMATSDVDLNTVGYYEVHPGLPAAGAESLITTYAAGGATAGAARVLVHYATPS
jgi:hypothetical protein